MCCCHTESIRTKFYINTLPVGLGIRKTHIQIYLKGKLILEKSLFPQDEYFTELDEEMSSP